jgi:antitoxin (DNA-binding transcriptional repressor) of toxin-antitoxin stability system
VRKGERFVITKHGQPVAELRPVEGHDSERARKTVAQMRKLRRALAARGVRLRKILEEGESLRDLTQSGHRY